jgi:hypothetical protein
LTNKTRIFCACEINTNMSHPAQLFDVLHVHPTLAPTSQVSAEAASARLQQTLRQLDQSSSATARFGAAFPAHVRTEDQYLLQRLQTLANRELLRKAVPPLWRRFTVDRLNEIIEQVWREKAVGRSLDINTSVPSLNLEIVKRLQAELGASSASRMPLPPASATPVIPSPLSACYTAPRVPRPATTAVTTATASPPGVKRTIGGFQ